ncbi:rhodanese-like domain-containing protein [Pseudonocardia sp. RS010]|uniref:rhodanese-like domain-containing protein n=1 Tax=Pseudonocardia sp. RS010 TaxID=3385979 RepID=UPI0039A18421
MTVREISVDDLAAASNSGEVTVIDVRNPDEYAAGHIPGAHLIPLPELGDRLAEVPTDRLVHVVCQSGGRSAQGAELLTGAGIDAVSVDGGTQGWTASGRPTTTG